MSATPTHRVFRCTVEVRGVPRAAAAQWRRRARGLWDKEIARGLAAELDLFSPADHVVRFDRLEIELRVNERTETVEIGQAVRQALRERLHNEMRQRDGIEPRPDRVNASVMTEREDWLERWLLTSLVPWWAGKPSRDELAAHLIERLGTPSGPTWLRSVLIRHPLIARRLALQFDHTWQQTALTTVWPSDWHAIVPSVMASAAVPPKAGTHPESTAELWEAGWRLWARAVAPSSELRTAADDAAAPRTPRSRHNFREVLLSEVGRSVPRLQPPDTMPASESPIASSIERATSMNPAQPGATRPTTAVPPGSGPAELREAPHHPNPRTHRPTTTDLELERVFARGLPVAQAGLVLIAPFLPRFFDALELRRTSDTGQTQADLAPLLVHFVATAASQAAEHELVVPKLLCGVPLDQPVICDQHFSETTRFEVDRLLTAAIQHWTALKQTSAQGLREAFLQRPGLLRDAGPQWSLHVEHRAWDILLERVPWTFRTIRLAWMPKPLIVEWDAYA